MAAILLLALVGFLYRPTTQKPVPVDPRLATARTQTELGEHRSAFQTYRDILKTAPDAPEVLTTPCEVGAMIHKKGERDWYSFDAKKGDAF